MMRPFAQIDVFSDRPLLGNPVAVVRDGEGLSDEQMAAFARWTNLSETTFLLPPTSADADYRLRIFTPGGELPFAGHPTLGSAAAWLLDNEPPTGGRVVQECGVGLVPVRIMSPEEGEPESVADGVVGALAFCAPQLSVCEPLADDVLARITTALGVDVGQVVAHQRLVNGPEWCALVVDSAQAVLDLRLDPAVHDLNVGVVGPHPEAGPADYEVRAFAPACGIAEDPVTGSLNAALAVWLIEQGMAPAQYTVRQGTALARDGRVAVCSDEDGVWVGGQVCFVIDGGVTL